MGRDDIKIKLNDGKERKLCDIQHVSDLQNNMLLIKMKDKLGVVYYLW